MDYSLLPTWVKTHSFADQLSAAKTGGFTRLPIGGVSVRELQNHALSLDDIETVAVEAGVTIGHFDVFTDWAPQRFAPDLIDEAKAGLNFSTGQCVEICERLSIDAICATAAFEIDCYGVDELAEIFSGFCAKAARYHIGVGLKFIPMWVSQRCIRRGTIVSKSGASNAGVLFDAW